MKELLQKTKRVFFSQDWKVTFQKVKIKIVNGNRNCFVTNIIQNMFCVQQKKVVRVVKWWQNFHFWVNYPFKIELLWWRRFLKTADQKPRGLERDFNLVTDTLRAAMMKERVYMCESVSWGSTLAFYEASASKPSLQIHRTVFEPVTHQTVARSSDLSLVSDSWSVLCPEKWQPFRMVSVLSQGIIVKREQRRTENGSIFLSFCFFPSA